MTANERHHSVKQGCAISDLGEEEQWSTEQQDTVMIQDTDM